MSVPPFSVSIPLAKNPQNPPQYSVAMKLANGEEISLVDPQATRAMVALMDMAAVMGGAASHWGGPAAFAEIMSAIYGYSFWASDKASKPYFDMFHIVNDAGHCENGIYALKANYGYADLNLDSLKGFRSMSSPLAGHGEVHLFRQGVYIAIGHGRCLQWC
jgi:transketolase